MSYLRRSIILLVVSSFLTLSIVSVSAAGDTDWRASQKIWWNDAELIKRAVIGYLRFIRLHSDEDGAAEDPYDQVMNLLLVLDDHNDAHTLTILVSLASYNIGVAGSELYACVITRKGSAILPFLQDARTSEHDECIETMGSIKNLCLTSKDYKSRLQNEISTINTNESCSLE